MKIETLTYFIYFFLGLSIGGFISTIILLVYHIDPIIAYIIMVIGICGTFASTFETLNST